MRSASIVRLILIAVLGAALEPVLSAVAQDAQGCERRYTGQEDIEWRFVRESLMYREYEGYTGVIARWAHPVTVEILSAKSGTVNVVRDVMDPLNAALQETGVALTMSDGEEGDIVIMTGRHETLLDLMRENGFDLPEEPWDGYVFVYIDSAHTPDSAVIFIREDIPDHDFRASVAQELFQALGPLNDTAYFPESVMYERTEASSTATRPSWIDLKLLRFVYRHLSPGDNECDLKQAYDRYWQSLVMP